MKKKVVILSLHMKIGGIEKAICSLANMLCDSYDIEIINVYKLQDKPAFYIDNKVKVSYLLHNIKPNKEEFKEAMKSKNILSILKEGLYSIKVLFLRRIAIKKAVKNLDADIMISSRVLFHKFLGKYQSNKLLIAWEHNHHQDNQKYKNELIKSINNFDYLIPVSKYLDEDYKNMLKKTKCLHLPLCIDELKDTTANLTSKQITIVGRLSSEKGFDDALRVFKLVLEQEPNATLNIVGDGPLRKDLENLAHQLHIINSVQFHGNKSTEELNHIYENTSCFMTTSHYESFGLVILEAMNYGIPCLSFDTAKGSKDMIETGKNGFIISNRNLCEMANKIIDLLAKPNNEMSSSAKETVKRYSFNHVKTEWLTFLACAEKIKTVVFIASAGGHFSELLCLEELFNQYHSYIITEKNKAMEQYKTVYGNKIFYLTYGTKEEMWKYLFVFPYNCIKSFVLFIKLNPGYIITTGAHTAVPICYIAKLFKKKIIFIETYANIKTKSLTGKLMYPIADLFLVQWEDMLELYPKAEYEGWLP